MRISFSNIMMNDKRELSFFQCIEVVKPWEKDISGQMDFQAFYMEFTRDRISFAKECHPVSRHKNSLSPPMRGIL